MSKRYTEDYSKEDHANQNKSDSDYLIMREQFIIKQVLDYKNYPEPRAFIENLKKLVEFDDQK